MPQGPETISISGLVFHNLFAYLYMNTYICIYICVCVSVQSKINDPELSKDFENFGQQDEIKIASWR